MHAAYEEADDLAYDGGTDCIVDTGRLVTSRIGGRQTDELFYSRYFRIQKYG
ncbi:hypothetical protein GCM10008014_43030 [Paenibacillus silvae]|uniref:Uncharacterized protein n=1 Tax=Paenibacillus silvae TaxID=1325358 RepID=A0ABQ1ZIU5_9BACL|nr:hypothetical protein GCM10008014_43030 [Paenibacillus silvae]